MLKPKNILSFLIAGFIVVGCSVEERYKVLSFVFDGVPNPYIESEFLKQDSIDVSDSILNKPQEVLVSSKVFMHSPYQKRECALCHNQNSMGKLTDQMPDLCYLCHENLNYQFDYLHGPVGAGYCNVCHHPHYSHKEKLLIEEGQQLCLSCHLQEDIEANIIHPDLESYFCSDCHGVHGGHDKSLLKDGSCFVCHESFEDKYKYLHGPVGSGYCKSCHGLHTLESKNLLLREGRQMCLHCHDNERLIETETHKDIGDADCTFCHNAHGGDTMDFLN